VALTHAEVLAAAEAWPVELPPVEAGDVGLVAAPLHQGAALMALAFVRRAAAQVGLGPSGAVASSLGSAVAGHRVTHAWLSASQIGAVLHEPGLRQADLSSLKVVAYGDGPLDAAADVNEATARVGAALVRLIVSAGLPVSPAEIEEVLLHHAGISQAAVTGVPDDRWGEAVTAMVVPAPGARLSEAEVLAFAGSQLPAWKKPKSVEFVTALPEASAT
jgi:acyl-coenzyme A synthetase/AMP-(fatty) acid ligase